MVIVNADQYIECDLQKILDEFNKHDGGMLTFRSTHPKNSFAKIGDAVTTSPASTLLPPNLTIGIVKFVNEKALPSPYAIVQLTASPDAIDWVQVLKNDAQK